MKVMKNRIVIKSSKAGMTVILDPECSFEELLFFVILSLAVTPDFTL